MTEEEYLEKIEESKNWMSWEKRKISTLWPWQPNFYYYFYIVFLLGYTIALFAFTWYTLAFSYFLSLLWFHFFHIMKGQRNGIVIMSTTLLHQCEWYADTLNQCQAEIASLKAANEFLRGQVGFYRKENQ